MLLETSHVAVGQTHHITQLIFITTHSLLINLITVYHFMINALITRSQKSKNNHKDKENPSKEKELDGL
jgi:hypothetical protein